MTSFWGKKAPVLMGTILCLGLSGLQNSFATQETSPPTQNQLITNYDLYWKGIRVVTADSTLTIKPETYDHQMTWRTRGMLSWFVKGKTNANARGLLNANFSPQAEHYSSDGKWGKRTFERSVVYGTDGKGSLASITDPWGDENEREPVPEGLDVGPDPVTLALLLMKIPVDLGQDQDTLTLTSYDGIRSMAYDVTCKEALQPLRNTGHSTYRGLAKECIIKARQTGGFSTAPREEEEKDPREDHGMSLLFQKLVGENLYVPVQGTFTTRDGTLKLYLTAINKPIQEIEPEIKALP